MLKKLVYLAFTILLFTSCSSEEDLLSKKALGGVKYGGELRFMMSEKVATLHAPSAIDQASTRITTQIFEPLLKVSENGDIEPLIAESFTISPDKKKYTFKIRKGVYFHEDDCFGGEGREVIAEDVKYSLDMACSSQKGNEMSYLLTDLIKGASEYNKISGSKMPAGGVKGITTSGDNLMIELNEPFAGFEKVMTHTGLGVIAKEAVEKYGGELSKHPVGTGAFMLETYDDNGITLKRNSRYWRKDEFGNQLPYLSKVIMTYSKDKKSELLAFRKEEVDLVFKIPATEVNNVIGSLQEAQNGKTVKNKVDVIQSLSTVYLAFQLKNDLFKDVRVRKAFNMALDRKTMVVNQLHGEGYPCVNGFIPNCEIYDATKVKGHEYNPTAAKALLASAGFVTGENSPIIEVLVNDIPGSTKFIIASAAVNQINANLDTRLKVVSVSTKKRNAEALKSNPNIWLTGWIADYPDAQNFLPLYYGPLGKQNTAFLNPVQYMNPEYDRLFVMSNKEFNEKKREQLIQQCDQILVNDAVNIPLITEDFIVMINAKFKNFNTNITETLDFSTIFIKASKEDAK